MADHVDLPRLKALTEYWVDHPPLHLMVAAYFGIKPQKSTKEPAEEQAMQMMDMFPTGPVPHIITPEEFMAKQKKD